jgi:hypothetical protein
MPELIWTHTTRNCRNLVSAQVWRVVAAVAITTCIFGFRLGLSLGYDLDFLPCALLVLGFASKIILSVKVKVLGDGFGLWLGDNIAILSMVKRAHLFF